MGRGYLSRGSYEIEFLLGVSAFRLQGVCVNFGTIPQGSPILERPNCQGGYLYGSFYSFLPNLGKEKPNMAF